MSKSITFVKIKTNSNKDFSNNICEKIIKFLQTDTFYSYNDDVQELIEDFDDIITINKSNDPVTFINKHFKNTEENKDENSNNYIVTPYYTHNSDQIFLLLTNSLLNSSGYMEKKTKSEQQNEFNLIASDLTKYYSNNVAIFGDVFIISMNKEYFTLLDKDMNSDKYDDIIKKFNKQIYYNIDLFNFIESYANVHYIKIYVKPTNNITVYSRDILEKYIKSPENLHEKINNNLIKCLHEKMVLYIKYTEAPINSYYYNIDKALGSNSSSLNNLYFTNITKSDIIFITNN
jgi:hypothetical protein